MITRQREGLSYGFQITGIWWPVLYKEAECPATHSGKESRDRGLTEALRSPAKHNDVWFQIIECIGDGKTAHIYGKVQLVQEKRIDAERRSKDVTSERRLCKWEKNYTSCLTLFSLRLLYVQSGHKKKVKCTLVQALRLCTGRTVHRWSRGIALLFHDQRH